ncbi:LysR substrate-binding domain-containing protein [Myroides odoratimimus]|uniref:LysR substrate-binding domain-containing protein n=1 Tax=Myroides odoratimimus TaxID=76832 RepID=UPI002DBD797C|nr:LysR substrate-binding domain-containing protein [Myroides odoratimimus]MEC4034337.1 LysR substrate-binding domain-containing protein [Myroides odoratimimus]
MQLLNYCKTVNSLSFFGMIMLFYEDENKCRDLFFDILVYCNIVFYRDMDIQQIKYFLALADELHFWNTASKMNITQSALSRQIQSLENELGVLLFYRDKRNVSLTPSGKFLQEKWNRELNRLDSFHHIAKQLHLGELGTIKIAYPDSISSSFIPNLLKRILEQYPNLKIELVQLPYQLQEQYLQENKIELLFSRDVCQSSIIEQRKLDSERLAFVVYEDHDFTSIRDITKESLSNQRLILATESHSSSYNEIINTILDSYEIDPNLYVQCDFGSTIIALVQSRIGISILPISYQYNQYKGVRFIPLSTTTDLYVQWKKDNPNPILKNIFTLI